MPGRKAPENETKEQRFVRLANGRALAAIKAIDGLGKLVGSQYASTSEQHKKLFAAIRSKADEAEKILSTGKPASVKKAVII